MLEAYLSVLELTYFEVKCVFDGLQDQNVWKRPAPGLLSIGEIAGHVCYWQATRFSGEGGNPPDLSKCHVSSPLIDQRFSYYPGTIETQPSEQHLAMSAEHVLKEWLRVHEESLAYFKSLNVDLAGKMPGWGDWWTYGESLKYTIFHVGYHAGQIYSVRHLLGETTPDN